MTPKVILAKYLSVLLRITIQILGKGKGETAPGLVALAVDPLFVQHTNRKVKTRILISGTNGKTTTTHLLKAILIQQGVPFVSNSTGSNLLRGIAAASLKITPTTQILLWEVDEAALVEIAQQVGPTHIVLTNIFRDQLDRYGEIDSILSKWLSILKKLPNLQLLLNADDPHLAYLATKLTQHTITFIGLHYPSAKKVPDDFADATFCPHCHQVLKYHSVHFSHLGDYSCVCGYSRPTLNRVAKYIVINEDQSQFHWNNEIFKITLVGLYNIYNALMALTVCNQIGISSSAIKRGFLAFKPVFGRQEILLVKRKKMHFYLVKNPTGFNQVIETLTNLSKKNCLVIAINDQIADGRDISWLWDVNFDQLNSSAKSIIVTGSRAYDLALRLKYAGFNENTVTIVPQMKNIMKNITTTTDKDIYVLPTYTAMWQLRELLLKN